MPTPVEADPVGEATVSLLSSLEERNTLANRFDGRATRLRRQANILLTIIIFVLLAGAAGFVFANDIASFNFRPQTAAAQYAAAEAAWKKKVEERQALQKRIDEIEDNALIAKPFDEQIWKVKRILCAQKKRNSNLVRIFHLLGS